jgi:hypothetical protein
VANVASEENLADLEDLTYASYASYASPSTYSTFAIDACCSDVRMTVLAALVRIRN